MSLLYCYAQCSAVLPYETEVCLQSADVNHHPKYFVNVCLVPEGVSSRIIKRVIKDLRGAWGSHELPGIQNWHSS